MNGGLTLNLNESSSSGLTTFRGKFQEAEAVNKNKRMYPFTVLESNVKALNECVKARGLVGELDHPEDSIIHFEKASHVVTKLWWEGNVLMGEGEILNTPHGKILKALINDGVRVGISSRGVGNGSTNDKGILMITESYKLITFDAVADPSTYQAFQRKITKENYNPSNFSTSESRGGYILFIGLETIIRFSKFIRVNIPKIYQNFRFMTSSLMFKKYFNQN
jgi:hypothetical protein